MQILKLRPIPLLITFTFKRHHNFEYMLIRKGRLFFLANMKIHGRLWSLPKVANNIMSTDRTCKIIKLSITHLSRVTVSAKLISAFVFATRIVQFLFFLNPKFQASSHPLWLHRPVCVGPGQKPPKPVFSFIIAFIKLQHQKNNYVY